VERVLLMVETLLRALVEVHSILLVVVQASKPDSLCMREDHQKEYLDTQLCKIQHNT
jgi:hypothetical protein